MLQSRPTQTEYAQAIAERDEAIAERDFLLNFFEDLGAAFDKSERLAFRETAEGIEIRSLYPSHADAVAVARRIHSLRSLVFFAKGPKSGALTALAAFEARVAAQLHM